METNKSINKNSPIPYYYQLKQIIIDGIEKGRWASNEKIPSENDLCADYKVSRTVVRQAINDLTVEGFLKTQKGVGTFVSEPKILDGMITNIIGFYDDMRAKGYTVETSIISQKKIDFEKKIAEYLEIPKETPLIEIKRVRKVNKEKVVFVSTYIPHNLCPGLLEENLENKSLYNILEKKYNLEIYSSKRHVGATAANEIESKILNIKKGSPLIFLDSVSYSKSKKPIEYFHALHRADRIIFGVDLIKYIPRIKY